MSGKLRFRAIPQIPPGVDPKTRAVLAALKENFEILAGMRGDANVVAEMLGYVPAREDAGVTCAFHAQYSGAGGAATQGNDIIYDIENFDVGGNYNHTDGRFTAPVSGYYFFAWHGLYANATTGDLRTALYKNGGGIYGMRFIDDKNYANWTTFIGSGVVYLTAGDYVTIRLEVSSTAIHTDSNYTGFSGFLIG